ncbi:hypothetical protein K439DRAFT_11778 [Ramaria rubella]|nr:hypothetical protein K439DRAFT_11778 [Ramaria rubella]
MIGFVLRQITMFNLLRTAALTSKAQTRLTLIGRLGRDPQVKTTTNDREYVLYTIATRNAPPPPSEDGTRPEATTSWHSVLSFNPTSNNYLKNLKKGYQVYVEASYELKDADPSADPDSPAAQRQIFLRHDRKSSFASSCTRRGRAILNLRDLKPSGKWTCRDQALAETSILKKRPFSALICSESGLKLKLDLIYASRQQR